MIRIFLLWIALVTAGILNGNGYPDPEETGFPTIGGDIFENNDLCNLTWTFEDVELPICDGSYKIRREWLIIDWCTGEEAEYNQLIKVTDSDWS
jgi:hypothetical protein